MTVKRLREKLHAFADAERAVQLQRFFKTGPGQYGESDRFIGVRIPQVRKLLKTAADLSMSDIDQFLHSPIHEERLLGLLVMVRRFDRADDTVRKQLYRHYLNETKVINNWDLVDVTAEHIVGGWLFTRSRKPLYKLARSKSLWERRIAIMATFHFIRKNDLDETLKLAEVLLHDEHDLIHKAVGWMLREVGKRERAVLEGFLLRHYHTMPRTMLRYAIEKFPEKRRQAYLKARV